jgi:spore coat protein CotH
MKKAIVLLLLGFTVARAFSQAPDEGPRFGPPGGGPRGFGGVQEKQKLVKQFDKDGDKVLNSAERKAAFAFIEKERAEGRGRRGPGGPRFGGFGQTEEPTQPGAKVSPAEVKIFPGIPLYDAHTVRTIFLEFEGADWEKQLAAFKNSDVEVPAKVTIDGKAYNDVGAHFRGMSSFMMVAEGRKRSMNLSFDFQHKDQQIGGYRTLNLLNSHEDPSFLRSVLSYQIDREYLPAPKANFMRVVINGESWGLYVNAEQFNKDFVKEWFGTTKGARWKVPGSPRGQGSLAYLGEDPAVYKKIYEIKTREDTKSWADLIKLCKVLNETSPEKLEQALSPILDIDGALKFLALDNALVNDDGYWIRTSDYSIYEDPTGKFHILPQDSNETFSRPGGPGFGGGPGGPRGRFGGRGGPPPESGPGGPRFGGPEGGRPPGGPGFGGGAQIKGVELDPLIAANDTNKPLISKLLAVPSLRAKYLSYVRDIAEKWLDWNKLGPIAAQYQALIADDVKADTRKLDSYEAFIKGIAGETPVMPEATERRGPPAPISLRSFCEQRRAYLLGHTNPKKTGI